MLCMASFTVFNGTIDILACDVIVTPSTMTSISATNSGMTNIESSSSGLPTSVSGMNFSRDGLNFGSGVSTSGHYIVSGSGMDMESSNVNTLTVAPSHNAISSVDSSTLSSVRTVHIPTNTTRDRDTCKFTMIWYDIQISWLDAVIDGIGFVMTILAGVVGVVSVILIIFISCILFHKKYSYYSIIVIINSAIEGKIKKSHYYR